MTIVAGTVNRDVSLDVRLTVRSLPKGAEMLRVPATPVSPPVALAGTVKLSGVSTARKYSPVVLSLAVTWT